MSEEIQEKGCGKATMYVITEKGLEVGPFVYTKDTDSRVICANTDDIYYAQRGKEHSVTDRESYSRRRHIEKQKVKVVNLGADSLPSDGLSDEFLAGTVRDIKKIRFVAGNLRTKPGLKSGKQRQNSATLNNTDNNQDEGLDIEVLKRLLQSKKEFDEWGKKALTPRREAELSLSGKRQIVLRRLRIRRQSEILLDEIAKLRRKSEALVHEEEEDDDRGKEGEKNKSIRILKNIFYPYSRAKLESIHQSSLVHLPSLQPTSIQREEKTNKLEKPQRTQHSFPSKRNKRQQQQLVFLSPRVQYNQSKAKNSAKININERKVNTDSNPKVRFPAVIDQRTGEMHAVPGVVAFNKSDYNQWSRRENIIRREVLPTRSPSLTYVSFLPSVSTKNNS